MTLYGLLAIVAGSVTSVAIALINRDRGEPADPGGVQGPAAAEDVDDPDLTTVEGIARMVVRQGRRIRQLEVAQADDRARIAAMSRYMHILKQTIRTLGGSVPEPDPRDVHLIDQH
ncbi:hypothetical protein ACFVHR_04920 [Streptomyces sp. NPDC127168]|uniref:hypothetical protein n=1 Tax=unclassified Streptomyces TaxID=2593676 RepID=UPI003631369E